MISSDLGDFTAGNSVRSNVKFDDNIKNTEYSAKIIFLSSINPKIEFNLISDVNDLNNFILNLTFSQTEDLKSGEYMVHFSYLKNDNSEKKTEQFKVINIKENVLTATHSSLAHAKKMLLATEKLLQEKVQNDNISYSINGKSVVKNSYEALEKQRALYKREIRMLELKESGARNKENKIKIYWTGNNYK